MAGNDSAVVFVSSSMSELPEERAIVKKVVQKLGDGTFETYLFEEDAVPSAETPQQQWEAQLERTQVTLALLYRKFGEYTEQEIRLSRELQVPVLLFRKKDKKGSLEAAAPDFVNWLQGAESGVITKWFETPKELKKSVKQALQKEIKAALGIAQGVRRQGAPTSVDGMDVEEKKAPAVPERSEPPSQLPEDFFVGREDEKQQLIDAIEKAHTSKKDRYIVLVGEPGVGKEALLGHVTHSGDLDELAPKFAGGTAVAPDWKQREDVEDLRQALWEEFFVPDKTVDPRQRDRQLKDVEALVFLVDLDESTDIRDVVQKTMPKSVFCGTVVNFDVAAEPLPIDGLTDDEEICAIFEEAYGGEFPNEATRTTFAEVCRRQGGNPGKIEFLGKQAKLKARPGPNSDGPHPLVGWVAELAEGVGVAPTRPRLAAVASEVGAGVHAPKQVLDEVAPDESVEEADEEGWLETGSPRYRLNPVLEPQPDPEVLPDLFAATLEWARTAPREEIFANRAFVLQMIARGVEEQRWSDVIAVGRATEASIAVGGRHGAWKELLDRVGEAARALGDDETLGWVLHQRGSRALLRDELRQGRGYLHQSLQYRRHDEDARELTRGNLMLLPAAVIPFAALVLVPLFTLLVGAAVLRGEERDPNLDIDFETVNLPTEGVVRVTEPFELSADASDGDQVTVVIDDASVDETILDAREAVFCIVVDGECLDGRDSGGQTVQSTRLRCPSLARDAGSLTVRAAEPCVIDVGFAPDLPGTYRARLRVETPGGAAVEGTLIGVATEAIVEISPDYETFESTDTQMFTMTNVGTASIDVGDPTLRPVRGPAGDVFDIGDLDCDGGDRTLEVDESCAFTVTLVGSGAAAFLEFELSVTGDDTDQQVLGDERVLLIAAQPGDGE